jgi:uncharacterized protein YcbK (DUF882 family)
MWRFKHFKESEFACKCCGLNGISLDLVTRLETARELAGVPFKINSGVRCAKHNKAVGGSKSSSHVLKLAVDIACTNDRDRFKIIEALIEAGFTRIGVNGTFIHVDVDSNKNSAFWFY